MGEILSEAEIRLLAEFILLPEKFSYQRFSKHAKDKVLTQCREHGWDITRVNLNNKLYSMIGKGILRRDDDSVIYIQTSVLEGALAVVRGCTESGSHDLVIRFSIDDTKEDRRPDTADSGSSGDGA